MLRALLFTILYLDFIPKFSETKSGSRNRGDLIMELIEGSSYSVHDLSRSKAMKAGEYPRFNMPYELGLAVGCYRYGTGKHKKKKTMILEIEKYNYQKVISDIAGQDIFSHQNDPEVLIKQVRDWFSINSNRPLTGPAKIWNSYNQFSAHLLTKLKKEGYTAKQVDSIPVTDYVSFALDWIEAFKKASSVPPMRQRR